jgi:hypothetical protein
MAEWSSYSLSDLLLFSLQAYIGLFELLNTTLWPAHLFTLALGLAMGLLVLKRHLVNRRLVWGLLGLSWKWTGWHFFSVQYAAIDWAATYVAPVALRMYPLFRIDIRSTVVSACCTNKEVSPWQSMIWF